VADAADIDRMWDYQDPAGTELRFRAVLPAARGGGDVGYLVELLTQIGRTYSLRGKFDEAHEVLDEAGGLIAAGMVVPRVRYLLERGRAFNSAGEGERARKLFMEAWEVANAAGDDARARELAIDAAHMIAIAETETQAQLKWNLKALEIAERVGSTWRAALYNNIGWTYHDAGDYPRALEFLEKGLVLREAAKKEPQLRIAKYAVAKVWRMMGRVDEALAVQRQLLKQLEEEGEEDGYVNEEVGECLLATGEGQEARGQFARAYALLSKDEWLVRNEGKRIERLKLLATGAA